MKALRFALAPCLISASSFAEVTRVGVISRTDVAGYDYEQIKGKVYFSVDPKSPANQRIADIDKAVASDDGAHITGIVRAAFIPDWCDTVYTVGEAAAYAPFDVNDAAMTLTVHDGISGKSQTIPRAEWKMAGNIITMPRGFEP